MGIFKNKHDPISDRARALNSEIAALEARIKEVNNQAQSEAPMRRSSNGPIIQAQLAGTRSVEPIFERVDQNRLKEQSQPATPHALNELGLRKYHLIGLIDRIRKHFYGPPVSNPRLVNYLAAGSVQGLRSLRYEKRVARNRFVAWAILLAIIVLGTLAAMLRR